MRKTFFINLFRDIKKSISRFLSIIIIITVGVAFYTGIRATSPSMKASADTYLAKHNFMDFKIISTLGVTDSDVKEIENLNGITKAVGSYSLDAIIEKNNRQLVININSLPAENSINNIKIIKGKLPESYNEVIVEDKFLENNNFNLGDILELKSPNDSKIQDTLKNDTFKIVGTSQSPLYISEQRQPSSAGNGIVRGFVYMLPEVFKNEVYTEIYVKTNSVESENSLLNNKIYNNYIKSIESQLKDIGLSRTEIRYNDVFKKSTDKLIEEEIKLNDAKKESEEKFSQAYTNINIEKNKILKGFDELEKNESFINQQLDINKKKIATTKEQLIFAEKEIATKKQQLEDSKKQLGDTNPIIVSNEYNLNQSILELEKNKKTVSESEIQLNKTSKENLEKIDSERKKLEEGQNKIDESIENLKSEENSANEKFKNGEAEIEKNKVKLNEIKKPEWYVLNRSQNAGYETYKQDSDRLDSIGKAFPLIFFLVSALVSLTTMTRMVQEKRIEIGTFKALGYSRFTIVSHYLIYALSASIIGSVLGVLLGFKFFPPLIMNAYSTLYTIGDKLIVFDKTLTFQSAIIAILFTSIAAIASTLEELREVPASLMRPKPPKSGKKILIEKVTFIWKRFDFTTKVTARNIFRYKQRLFMTVIGIAACTGLMIVGFGLKDGILGAVESQFNNIYKYDMQGTLIKNLNEVDKDSLKIKSMDDSNIKSMLFTYSKNASIKIEDDKNQNCYLIMPENNDEFNNYINLTINNENLKLHDDGVILTKKLSKILNKKPGDDVEITLENSTFKAKVSAVTDHYVQHYIYISPSYYKKLTNNNVNFNSYYGLLNNLSDENQNNTLNTLKSFGDFNSVEFRNNLHINFNKITSSINSVIPVLIISAGILAFVVIFNLTNINIEERKRELATIKLLGFYNHELASYIYRENIILTFIGSLVGIPVGIMLNKFIITTAETNDMMFLQTISFTCYLNSILLTLLFSIVVNIAMYKRFDKIDMIESLKSAE